MENFVFESPTRLILEANSEQLVGKEIKKYSSKVLCVHYGDTFIYESGLHKKVMDSIKEAGLECIELTGITPNPVLAPIYKGIDICRAEAIGFILAVGGGSVIDTAKAIAAGTLYDGDVWDLYTGKAFLNDALPVGAIMTLPGTGSEGSNGSVVTNENTDEKRDIMGDCIRPSFAIMNPELTYTLPTFQTNCGIVDMMSHVMERYFSTSKNNEVTDRICEGLMKAIITSGRKVNENPKDYDARADLMLGAVLAHNGLGGIGRNQDWACHMMGAQLSGYYNAVHGATLSVLIPAWATYVYKNHEARFVQFANRVFNIDINYDNQSVTALEGIARLKEFYSELNMPSTLKELKIENDDKLKVMAAAACGSGTIGCIKPLDPADVEKIYRSVL